MKSITFYFDVISPYAALAFERLPEALEGLNVVVDYRPILFAGLLKAWGQKGPAEMEPKRQWTFRQVAWSAHRLGIELQTPAEHPFNPLALQRLAWACGPNRRVVEKLFHHVWHGGLDANHPGRLERLQQELAPACDPADDEVKQTLRQATEDAIARGVFGVPTLEVDGRLFWGLDSLDMAAAYLRGDSWFRGDAWDEAGRPRAGVVRRER
ncbi:2-hydroxychromene-2-carboxylate isomerase [Roseateles toxinivorans]|uniref:2-hydroxychromene-2-carboxylate isomerase n=1 Tax=Roseateles toxinivorans TaxID=270368 RepID=A0A4R6QCK3_9BURK|nr:2-hydroxychromene-2-carboxylate isomerase [Roseateles toxinivorans]TDP59686.1 2-hydroxychromene-2-carboxylate isomerase [Roseateles toxinivorans]